MTEPKMRRTEITIETHSLTIIRTQSGKPLNLKYCRMCDKQSTVFQLAHAVLIFQVALTELKQLLQNNQIHFAENGDLCGNSLATYIRREIRCVED